LSSVKQIPYRGSYLFGTRRIVVTAKISCEEAAAITTAFKFATRSFPKKYLELRVDVGRKNKTSILCPF